MRGKGNKKNALARRSVGGDRSPLRVYYQNVGGMKTKLDEFYCNTTVMDMDIICITETWLNDGVLDSEIADLDSFSIFRRDRSRESTGCIQGGGVCIMVKNELKATQVCCTYEGLFDVVMVRFGHVKRGLYLCVVYIPPGQPLLVYEAMYRVIEVMLSDLEESDCLMIVGDFNLPNYVKSVWGPKEDCFENFLSFYHLRQMNEISNDQGGLLDFVNYLDGMIEISRAEWSVLPEGIFHPALCWNLYLERCKGLQHKTGAVYNFPKGDYEKMYRMICDIEWNRLIGDANNVNNMVNVLYDTIYEIMDLCIPVKTIKSLKYPKWIRRSTVRKINRKKRLLKKFKITKCNHYRLIAKQLEHEIRWESRESYKKLISDSQAYLASDPGRFWEFIRMKNNSGGLPAEMSDGTNMFRNGADICNGFAAYFNSVYSVNSLVGPTELEGVQILNESIIDLKCFTEEELNVAFKKLRNSRTMGLDGIPNYLVKGCSDGLKLPLLKIYNLALKQGIFPERFKESRVCPILKNGKRNIIDNYRPVSVLNGFAKLFEMLIVSRLEQQTGNIWSEAQHGFTRGRSTATNLGYFTQIVADVMVGGGQVDCVYLDFKKAFDRVDHSILLKKLYTIGISVDNLGFFASYLSNRKNIVCANGFKSDPFGMSSGVPQGSNLGPFLFKVFVNDLSDSCSWGRVLLFADDCKLFRAIEGIEDNIKLQRDIEKIVEWTEVNNLALNINKCIGVSFTRKRTPYTYGYRIAGEVVPRKNQYKDLGVTFDGNMTFTLHIEEVLNKSIKRLGFLKRNTKQFSDISCIKTLYHSLVVSVIRYCDVVWNPIYSVHINKLEAVQRKFLRFLLFKQIGVFAVTDNCYSELCMRFQMLTLENIRKIDILMFCYRVLNGVIQCELLQFIPLFAPVRRNRQCLLFYVPFARVKAYEQCPIVSMCRCFNMVSESLDIFFMSGREFNKKLKELYSPWIC